MMKTITRIAVLVVSLCSCNMSRYYAHQRIGHAGISTSQEVHPPSTGTPEHESTINSCSDTNFVALPQISAQPKKPLVKTEKPTACHQKKTKKTIMTFVQPSKTVKKIIAKKVKKKITRKLPLSSHEHPEKGGGGNLVLALVLVGLVIGIIVAIVSGSPLAGILIGIGVVLLVLIGIAAGIALIFWLLFKTIFDAANRR